MIKAIESHLLLLLSPTQRLIGKSAKNQATYNPTNTVFDAERLIGRKYSDSIIQNDIKLWPFRVIACADGSHDPC
ncbi:unnamed protein product [Lathyrus oleraceus]